MLRQEKEARQIPAAHRSWTGGRRSCRGGVGEAGLGGQAVSATACCPWFLLGPVYFR